MLLSYSVDIYDVCSQDVEMLTSVDVAVCCCCCQLMLLFVDVLDFSHL